MYELQKQETYTTASNRIMLRALAFTEASIASIMIFGTISSAKSLQWHDTHVNLDKTSSNLASGANDAPQRTVRFDTK